MAPPPRPRIETAEADARAAAHHAREAGEIIDIHPMIRSSTGGIQSSSSMFMSQRSNSRTGVGGSQHNNNNILHNNNSNNHNMNKFRHGVPIITATSASVITTSSTSTSSYAALANEPPPTRSISTIAISDNNNNTNNNNDNNRDNNNDHNIESNTGGHEGGKFQGGSTNSGGSNSGSGGRLFIPRDTDDSERYRSQQQQRFVGNSGLGFRDGGGRGGRVGGGRGGYQSDGRGFGISSGGGGRRGEGGGTRSERSNIEFNSRDNSDNNSQYPRERRNTRFDSNNDNSMEGGRNNINGSDGGRKVYGSSSGNMMSNRADKFNNLDDDNYSVNSADGGGDRRIKNNSFSGSVRGNNFVKNNKNYDDPESNTDFGRSTSRRIERMNTNRYLGSSGPNNRDYPASSRRQESFSSKRVGEGDNTSWRNNINNDDDIQYGYDGEFSTKSQSSKLNKMMDHNEPSNSKLSTKYNFSGKNYYQAGDNSTRLDSISEYRREKVMTRSGDNNNMIDYYNNKPNNSIGYIGSTDIINNNREPIIKSHNSVNSRSMEDMNIRDINKGVIMLREPKSIRSLDYSNSLLGEVLPVLKRNNIELQGKNNNYTIDEPVEKRIRSTQSYDSEGEITSDFTPLENAKMMKRNIDVKESITTISQSNKPIGSAAIFNNNRNDDFAFDNNSKNNNTIPQQYSHETRLRPPPPHRRDIVNEDNNNAIPLNIDTMEMNNISGGRSFQSKMIVQESSLDVSDRFLDTNDSLGTKHHIRRHSNDMEDIVESEQEMQQQRTLLSKVTRRINAPPSSREFDSNQDRSHSSLGQHVGDRTVPGPKVSNEMDNYSRSYFSSVEKKLTLASKPLNDVLATNEISESANRRGALLVPQARSSRDLGDRQPMNGGDSKVLYMNRDVVGSRMASDQDDNRNAILPSPSKFSGASREPVYSPQSKDRSLIDSVDNVVTKYSGDAIPESFESELPNRIADFSGNNNLKGGRGGGRGRGNWNINETVAGGRGSYRGRGRGRGEIGSRGGYQSIRNDQYDRETDFNGGRSLDYNNRRGAPEISFDRHSVQGLTSHKDEGERVHDKELDSVNDRDFNKNMRGRESFGDHSVSARDANYLSNRKEDSNIDNPLSFGKDSRVPMSSIRATFDKTVSTISADPRVDDVQGISPKPWQRHAGSTSPHPIVSAIGAKKELPANDRNDRRPSDQQQSGNFHFPKSFRPNTRPSPIHHRQKYEERPPASDFYHKFPTLSPPALSQTSTISTSSYVDAAIALDRTPAPPPVPVKIIDRVPTPTYDNLEPSGLTMALTRLADLEAQMEFEYAKFTQLFVEQQLLKIQYDHSQTFEVGVDAFSDDLAKFLPINIKPEPVDVVGGF